MLPAVIAREHTAPSSAALPEDDPADPAEGNPSRLLVVCTGNAARSVMAGFMLEHLAAERGLMLEIATAGTHTIDGQPMSGRTRAALRSIPALAGGPHGRHRSRQVHEPDLEAAALVVAMEADHVRYVRRVHPEAASRTATIRRLCAELPSGPPSLPERIALLRLDGAELSGGEDVADPAGRTDDVYAACAAELWGLCREFVSRL
jgi:protein-tyrosine-phosphatase